ncbi:helix-hairpin-helix domain-containing protein [Streptomyces sparsogenes]|uniref:helix-hairpin-helix domain-containing protein n=1 Tax=Streptomyces sparsogenes TaxID=67365 RepID=UPI0033E877D1
MSTDRLAGDAASAPEEEPTTGAPAAGTDADTGTGTGPAGPTAAPPSGAEAAPDATKPQGGAPEPPSDGAQPQGDATQPPGGATAPPGATAPLGGATQTPTDTTEPPGDATEPPADGARPPGDATVAPRGAAVGAGGGKRSAAAEALAAAVRAVESGERSAASFFTDTPAARQSRAAARGAGAGPEGARERTGGPGREQSRASAPGGLAPASGALAGPGAGTGAGAGAGQPVRAVPRAVSGPVDSAPGAAEVRRVLAEGGAPESLAGAVVAALGEGAAEALREDPWQLLAVAGVRPDQTDGFARALLGPSCGPGDERRAQALTVWLLERAALEGHTALESSALRAGLAKLSVPDPDAGLRSAIADGRVLVFQDALDTPGAARPATGEGDGDGEDEQPVRVLLGLDRFALAEESLADGLARLASTFSDRLSATAPGGAGDEDSDAGGGPGAADAAGAGTAARQAEAGAAGADEPEPAEAEADTAGAGGAGAPPTAAAAEAGGAATGSHTTGATGADTGSATGADGAPPTAAAAEAGGAATGSHADGVGRGGAGAVGSSDAGGWEAAAAAAPSPSAAELIRAVAGHGLVAHTGGEAARAEPAALVAAAGSLGLRAYAAAHTEDGRRRLAELIDEAAAVTVAGLLTGHEGPGRDEDGALALDLIAVLDAPQLDVETAAMLVESLPDGARLVLSGDPGVLWSAGPGKVFADLLAARRCPQVVSRTPDPGPIGELVSGIGIGELNQVEAPGKEVVIVPVRDAGEAVHRTVQLVADSVPRALGVPSEHTQVITPGHGGAAGTRALNAALKERLNPGPGRFGGFDPGDRVAYVPAPGRALPGTVVSADAEGLHLDCAGTAVVVPREQVADTVRPGWALTAHQAVGTRWPAAVVVLPQDAAAGLTRAWVYTAFSRGERHLSVVHGADAALARAVAEIPATERTTRLRSLLQTQLPSMAR